jgi:cation transport regulator ChaC
MAPPAGAHFSEPFVTTGVRVPSFVVSPLLPRGSVCHALLDHTSILQLLAEKFDGTPSGYSDAVTVDHRGTQEQPGRVVTLIEEPGAECWGFAYRVDAASRDDVLRVLDEREQGGYRRVNVRFVAKDRDRTGEIDAVTYLAGPDNPNYLGPADIDAIADQVRRCSGPSGHNSEYVLRLAEALSELNASDEHVFELANRVTDPQGTALD